mgnify:CR=1 FL=1
MPKPPVGNGNQHVGVANLQAESPKERPRKPKRVAENMNQQASNQRERPEIKVDEKEDTTQTADEEILM